MVVAALGAARLAAATGPTLTDLSPLRAKLGR